MIKAIIFDCFGVLIGRGFHATYRIAGGDPERDNDFIKDMLDRANLGQISEDAFHEAITARLGMSLDAYHQVVANAEQQNLELLDYIVQLRKTYKTAILSNVNRGVLEYRFSQEQLQKCFNVIVASGEVGIVKPDPAIYHLAADKLGVEPEACIFIDDHEQYCRAARDVGMQAILYKDFPQVKTELEQLLQN